VVQSDSGTVPAGPSRVKSKGASPPVAVAAKEAEPVSQSTTVTNADTATGGRDTMSPDHVAVHPLASVKLPSYAPSPKPLSARPLPNAPSGPVQSTV